MTPTEMPPAKRQAYELMLRDFERIGERYHRHTDDQLELLREWEDNAQLWRLAGFGDPPPFHPARPGVSASQFRKAVAS